MTYFSNQARIKRILKEIPETRDNDHLLIAYVVMELEEKKLTEITAHDYFVMLKAYKYRSLESITRARRKLQEKHPELRGTKYALRHKFEQAVINQLYFEFFA